MSATSRSLAGWTLIELCVVISLIALMVTMVVPAWYNHMQNKQLKAAQQTLHNAINFVRVLAITKHQSLALCSSNENWAEGFKVVVSQPGKSCQQLLPLREWHFKHAGKLNIHWRGFNRKQLIFYSQPNHWAVNGRFTLSMSNQDPIKLVINRLGRISKVS